MFLPVSDMNRIKQSRDTMRPPSDETVRKLLDTALQYGKTWGNRKCGIIKRRWWAALMWLRIYLFAVLGLRTSEACGLKFRDFHLDEGYVEIVRAFTKTGAPKRGSQRNIDLSPKVVKNLKMAFEILHFIPEDLVFSGDGTFLTPWAIRSSLKEIAKAAGVDDKNIYPQMFRIKLMTEISSVYGPDVASRVAGHSMRKGKGPGIIIEHYWKHGSSQQEKATQKAQEELVADSFPDLPLPKPTHEEQEPPPPPADQGQGQQPP